MILPSGECVGSTPEPNIESDLPNTVIKGRSGCKIPGKMVEISEKILHKLQFIIPSGIPPPLAEIVTLHTQFIHNVQNPSPSPGP